MATTKSYTDVSQSKVLAKILPLESSDMYHFIDNIDKVYKVGFGYRKETADYYSKTKLEYIPCWSLASLLDTLPNENMLVKTTDGEYYCLAKDVMTKHYDNSIDACVTMIELLHELKML